MSPLVCNLDKDGINQAFRINEPLDARHIALKRAQQTHTICLIPSGVLLRFLPLCLLKTILNTKKTRSLIWVKDRDYVAYAGTPVNSVFVDNETWKKRGN